MESLALARVATNHLEHSLGETHSWVAAGLHRVALLLDGQGRHDEAETVHRRALMIRERLHRTEIECFCWKLEKERLQDSESRCTASSMSNGGSIEVAASLSALAELLRVNGTRLDEALQLNERALFILEV